MLFVSFILASLNCSNFSQPESYSECSQTSTMELLKNALRKVVFPTSGRKQMLFLSIRNDKQPLKNYRPKSFLPICSKVLDRLLEIELFKFFIQNNFITPNLYGFKTGGSCITNLFPLITKYTNHLMIATKYGVIS